jgi:hypothetical protein
LNPLLNPVLGQNMGRWAEVYFTSPPEKREQAVLELLRELQAENSTSEGTIVTSPSSLLQEQPSEAAAEVQQEALRCHACGWENPASHRFCGMCGKPVAGQGAADLHISDLHVADLHTEEPPQNELAVRVQSNESQFVRADDAVYEPALSTNELPPFQGIRDVDYRDDQTGDIRNDQPALRSYRVYVGIAVAIVVFVVGYIAWRGMQATLPSAHVEPLAPPAVTTPPAAPEPTPPSASKTNAPNLKPSANQQTAIPSHPDPESAQASARSSGDKTAQIAPPTTPGTLVGSGAEELAMAQRYLNGTDGQERDRTEAAKWLWRAVAKHNADATLLLSDLYLKGDGVGKNCDQARVLLDAAARKGVKDAGDRLRHLQAFGCD